MYFLKRKKNEKKLAERPAFLLRLSFRRPVIGSSNLLRIGAKPHGPRSSAQLRREQRADCQGFVCQAGLGRGRIPLLVQGRAASAAARRTTGPPHEKSLSASAPCACQRADRGFGKIADAEPGGVQLVAGAHAADNRNPRLLSPLNQQQLSRHGVHRVHDIIIVGEIKSLAGIRPIKQVENLRLAIWVDILVDHAGGLRHPAGPPPGLWAAPRCYAGR